MTLLIALDLGLRAGSPGTTAAMGTCSRQWISSLLLRTSEDSAGRFVERRRWG